mgnify:CR=1 FL=1
MLYNVLKAYAVMDQSLGYCQSMSYITAILLLHLEEEVPPTLPPPSPSFDELTHYSSTLLIKQRKRFGCCVS